MLTSTPSHTALEDGPPAHLGESPNGEHCHLTGLAYIRPCAVPAPVFASCPSPRPSQCLLPRSCRPLVCTLVMTGLMSLANESLLQIVDNLISLPSGDSAANLVALSSVSRRLSYLARECQWRDAHLRQFGTRPPCLSGLSWRSLVLERMRLAKSPVVALARYMMEHYQPNNAVKCV